MQKIRSRLEKVAMADFYGDDDCQEHSLSTNFAVTNLNLADCDACHSVGQCIQMQIKNVESPITICAKCMQIVTNFWRSCGVDL